MQNCQQKTSGYSAQSTVSYDGKCQQNKFLICKTMKDEVAEKSVFSEKFEELMQRMRSRDVTKQMSNEELRNLKKAIDDEIIRRKVVEHIQILANQLK
nr:MAG TPA: hypothetical protein [Microviridae sp.]